MPAPPTVAAHKMHFHRDFPWKEPVRVATTAPGTLSIAFANGQSVDGVTLATGDRILLKDQGTGSQNGLYTVNASGAPTRAYDMDVATEVLGSLVYVVTGGQAGTWWYCTNTTLPTLGSTTLAFAQIGSGTTNAELNYDGGQDVIKPHGSLGATATFDPADGNIHTGTLTANCTVTIAAPAGSGGATLELWITQDGTGGWTLTIVTAGGSFVWDGTAPSPSTAAGITVRYVLERIPATTNDWVGDLVGGGGTVAALDDLSDVTITTPITDDVLTYDGAGWVNAPLPTPPLSGIGELVITDTPSTPLVFADILQNETQTDLLYGEP
jgi:hypothetical protein